VFLGGGDLDISIAGLSKEGTFFLDGRPVPFEKRGYGSTRQGIE